MNIFLRLIALTLLIGIYRVESKTSIYGDLANIEDHPYYAYLTHGYTKNLKCGGAIIHTDLILTAAHCLDHKYFNVYVGVSTLTDLENVTPYSVNEVLKHPWFTDKSIWDDIGFVKLSKEIEFGPKVRVIGLATVNPPLNIEGEIIGFGKVDCTNDSWDPTMYQCEDVTSEYLRSGLVKVVGSGYQVIYTEGRSLNTCYGDSGGPLVYNDEIVGIVTAASYNGCSSYNTQVSIADKLAWIEYYMDNMR